MRTIVPVKTPVVSKYAAANDKHGVVTNPVRPLIHHMKEPDTAVIRLSEAQLQRLLEPAKGSGNRNLYPAILLAARAGLRLEEVMHVEGRDLTFGVAFDDVYVANGRACDCVNCVRNATRRGQKKPSATKRLNKSEAHRYVPLAPDVAGALQAHQAEIEAAGFDPRGRLFICLASRGHGSQRKAGDPFPADELSRQVRVLEEMTGVAVELARSAPDTKRKPFHELRSTARSRWSENSGNTEQINLAMGHGLQGMAAHYTTPDRQRAYESLEGAKVDHNQLGKQRDQKAGKQVQKMTRRRLLKVG